MFNYPFLRNKRFYLLLRIFFCIFGMVLLIALSRNVWASPEITGTLIWGQPDSTSNAVNNGGISANSLNNPYAIAADSAGNLFVADSLNNRVLFYPAGTTRATRVIGQKNFTSNTSGTGSTGFNFPVGLAVDSMGGLYVSDRNNNRVLYFPKDSSSATRVYGQPNFNSYHWGIGPSSLRGPTGLALAGNGGLYVADTDNNRVLFFPPGVTTAARVYGQPNFNLGGPNYQGVNAKSLYRPQGVGLDNSGGVYIADTWNNRVLFFLSGSITATVVYGQESFNTNNANRYNGSFRDLFFPGSLVVDSTGGLYIADTGNGRVLHYNPGSTIA
jgi:sugar lactone lactonase YvrE